MKIGLDLPVKSGLDVASLYIKRLSQRVNVATAPIKLSVASILDRTPDGLVVALTDLRAVDPYIAEELARGRVILAGKVLETMGQSPFQLPAPSHAFYEKLHGFIWLRHVRATRSEPIYTIARKLVQDWISSQSYKYGQRNWDAHIAAQRLICWLSHSPVILNEADANFYRKFLKSLMQHIRYLRTVVDHLPVNEIKLKVRIALAMASLALPTSSSKINKIAQQLSTELNVQILHDGGHISRNPKVLVDLLMDLLPLRQCYINLGYDVPQGIVTAIDRMFGALRFFRHSDGDLALFNGSTAILATDIASVLRYDETASIPLREMPDSGYQRLAAGDAILIVDTGKSLSMELSQSAHAGALSFEFSSNNNRFIVNSGMPQFAPIEYQRASRSTAAHSTLTLQDTSSSLTASGRFIGSVFISGVNEIDAVRTLTEDGKDTLVTSHDGYVSLLGYYHEREFQMSSDGRIINGFDRLKPVVYTKDIVPQTVKAVSRFHIHPNIHIYRVDEYSVYLCAIDGTNWLFTSINAALAIEEDVFMADSSGMRPSRQLEIAFDAKGSTEIQWMLQRAK